MNHHNNFNHHNHSKSEVSWFTTKASRLLQNRQVLVLFWSGNFCLGSM